MRRTFRGLVTAVLLASGASLVAQTAVPDIPFDTIPSILQTPNEIHVGEVAGVGANSKLLPLV